MKDETQENLLLTVSHISCYYLFIYFVVIIVVVNYYMNDDDNIIIIPIIFSPRWVVPLVTSPL